MIVAVFMLGLGIGGLLGGFLATRALPLLLVFVAAEVGIGGFGFVSSSLLRAVGGSQPIARADLPLESAVYFVVLLFPTLLMGLSLPVLIQVFRARHDVGSGLGLLYSANVLGAATGALVSGFLLVGTIGVDLTCKLMALINFGIAVAVVRLAMWPARRHELRASESTENARWPGRSEAPLAAVCVLSVVAGAVALSYEIAYFRIFSAYFGLTGYIFPTLLAAYLVCLAAGNAVFGLRAARDKTATFLAVGSAGATLATLPALLIPPLLTAIGIDPRYLVLLQTARPIVLVQLVGILGLSVVLLAPIAFLAAYFPLLARSAAGDPRRAGNDVGWIYFSQTMGNALGVVGTGLVLLPTIGSVGTLKLLAVLLAALPIGFILARRAFRDLPRRRIAALAAICLACAVVYPSDFYRSIRVAGQEPELVLESTVGVSLAYREPDLYRVTVGREGTAAFPTDLRSFSCSPYEFAGLLTTEIRRALIIGIGPGVLPLCLQSMYPGVAVDVVELNPSLMSLMQERAAATVRQSLEHSSIYVTDGRRFVHKHPDFKYDLIQIGVYHVTASGAGSLFTEEFQSEMRDMLTPQGLLTFNAYPPAIRASLGLFRNVFVISHDDAVASVFMSNGPMRPLNRDTLASLPHSTFPDGAPTRGRTDWATSCAYERERVAELVSVAESQRDDLPVTEYFLTKRQNIQDQAVEIDLRRWGCDRGSVRLSDLLG